MHIELQWLILLLFSLPFPVMARLTLRSHGKLPFLSLSPSSLPLMLPLRESITTGTAVRRINSPPETTASTEEARGRL